VTEKDAARIRPEAADAGSIEVVPLDFALPEAALQALHALLPAPPPVRPRPDPGADAR
jgi:hypothetical protein